MTRFTGLGVNLAPALGGEMGLPLLAQQAVFPALPLCSDRFFRVRRNQSRPFHSARSAGRCERALYRSLGLLVAGNALDTALRARRSTQFFTPACHLHGRFNRSTPLTGRGAEGELTQLSVVPYLGLLRLIVPVRQPYRAAPQSQRRLLGRQIRPWQPGSWRPRWSFVCLTTPDRHR
jgi:hypothetical protein